MDDHIKRAKEAVDDESFLAPVVYVPPTIKGRKSKKLLLHEEPVSIRDHIIRIQTDGDPLGQLIAMMHGQLIPSFIADEKGNLTTVYESATVAQRIAIAKWLGEKIMPKVNVNLKGGDDDWQASLKNAATRADGD